MSGKSINFDDKKMSNLTIIEKKKSSLTNFLIV